MDALEFFFISGLAFKDEKKQEELKKLGSELDLEISVEELLKEEKF